jgi:hypothetical protein
MRFFNTKQVHHEKSLFIDFFYLELTFNLKIKLSAFKNYLKLVTI